MLDVDRGYRNSVERSWRFTKLSDGPAPPRHRWRAQVLSLSAVIGEGAKAPPVRLEPTAGGRVRISSPLRLAVRSYDEQLPTASDGVVEVPYGSVVRVGPVLFSVLYSEQLDSMSQGRFALPFVGAALDSQPVVEERDGSSCLEERASILHLWKLVFGTAILLAGLSAVALALGRGYHFRYGNSPLDTVAACVGCAVLAWTVVLTVGIPIQRRIVDWVYAGCDDEP